MNSKVSNTDGLRRIRTYPSTPNGFDPNKASPKELMQYGLPQRPDPEKQPELARIWKRVFARPIKVVEAEHAVDSVISVNHPRKEDSPDPGAFTSGWIGWAGVFKRMIKGSDFSNPATMVFGQLQLPNVEIVQPNKDVCLWVGLDGAPGGIIAPEAASQLLRACVTGQNRVITRQGVTHEIDLWNAWVEWGTTDAAGSYLDLNIPMARGDLIAFLICVPQPDFASVWIANLTQGIGQSVGFPAPAGVTSQGQSAEWIVEVQDPDMQAPDNPIPFFSPVTFTDCTAGSLQNGIFHLTDGITTNIVGTINGGPATAAYTETVIASPTVAVVEDLMIDW